MELNKNEYINVLIIMGANWSNNCDTRLENIFADLKLQKTEMNHVHTEKHPRGALFSLVADGQQEKPLMNSFRI